MAKTRSRQGSKIDDKTREEIFAYYASCGNMNKTAKHFGVSWSTVKRIAESRDDLSEVREQKKAQWIDEAWKTIGLYMKHVQDPKVVKRTSARDSAILIGTLHDKMLKEKELKLKQQEIELKRKEIEEPQTSRVVIVDDISEVEENE